MELQLNQQRGGALLTATRIVRKEGVLGLWKGNGLNLLRTAPYRSINYFTYDNTKAAILNLTGRKELDNAQRLIAGATAGAVAIICCIPLDVVRTRMLSKGGEQLYRSGIVSTLGGIVKGEGLLALYSGVVPALLSVAPSNAVFYTVYDMLKTNHMRQQRLVSSKKKKKKKAEEEDSREKVGDAGAGKVRKGSANGKKKKKRTGTFSEVKGEKEEEEEGEDVEMDPRFNLLYGGLGGIAAETSVYPLEVLRRRLQQKTQAHHAVGSLKSMGQILSAIVTREGMKGLYRGILPTACQVLPSAAISYYIFEESKKRLDVKK